MRSGIHTRAGRTLFSAVLVMVMVVTTTGCLTGDLRLKVNADGGGALTMEVFPSSDLQRVLADASVVNVGKDFVGTRDGASFEQRISDGRVSYKAKIPFEDFTKIGPLVTSDVNIGGKTIRLFSTFSLDKTDDDHWELRAQLDPAVGSGDLTSGPSTEQLVNSEGKVPLDSDLRLSISLPGRVTHSNANKIDGGTGQWNLRSSETKLDMVMFTEPKPLLTTPQKLLAGAIVAVLVGVFLVVFGAQHAWGKKDVERKRRKKMKFPGKGQSTGDWAPPVVATGASAGGRDASALPEVPLSFDGSPNHPVGGEPLLVAPPVAPVVDPSQPNPFAPHRPGVPVPVHDVGNVDELIHKAEEATVDYATFSHSSPENELFSLEHKAEAVHPDRPVAPLDEAEHDVLPPSQPSEQPVGQPFSPELNMDPSLAAIEESVSGPSQAEWFAITTATPPAAQTPPDPVTSAAATDPVAPVEYPDVTVDVVDNAPEPVGALVGGYEADGDWVVGDGAEGDRAGDTDSSAADVAAEVAPDVPPDWYPDPDDANRYRWWDGQDWTDYVS